MKLVLFDIDGTLLHCGGATREPFAQALEEVCGTAGSLRSDTFGGRTDDEITFGALASAGLSDNEILDLLPRIKDRFVEILQLRVDHSCCEELPGVRETLDRLTANSSVRLALATGNWRRGAAWKLQLCGLDRYFEVGAFGDGNRDRIELPPVALAVAREHFEWAFEASDVLIVGDTPNDVRCARHHGIPVVALATGYASRQDLDDSGADWVCDSLVDAGYLEPMLTAGAGAETSG